MKHIEPVATPGGRRATWLAFLLAVLATPIAAMLYLGRGRRALAYLLLLSAATTALPILAGSGLWPAFVDWRVPLFTLWVGGTLDSLRIAGKVPAEFRSPWYSRWYGVAGAILVLVVAQACMRAFALETFHIPSGAMMPTLMPGGFVLVNKYVYGLRHPFTGETMVAMQRPQRGDVMVFRYPPDPSLTYLKRVIGIPGDTVSYHRKRLSINNEAVAAEPAGEFSYLESGLVYVIADRFEERLPGRSHPILVQAEAPAVHASGVKDFPFRKNCVYDDQGFTCSVPPGHYFTMGDNRDSSSDSRYWGFVPERYVLGKIILAWGGEVQSVKAATPVR